MSLLTVVVGILKKKSKKKKKQVMNERICKWYYITRKLGFRVLEINPEKCGLNLNTNQTGFFLHFFLNREKRRSILRF